MVNFGTTARMQISNTVMQRLLQAWSTGGNLNTARGQQEAQELKQQH
jgi:hypothetical protein